MKHIPIANYFSDNPQKAVYRINGVPGFSPLDINLEFLHSKGWSINTDRVRFHTEMKMEIPQEHPMAQIFGNLNPHLLLRKIDKEGDYFERYSHFAWEPSIVVDINPALLSVFVNTF